MNRFPTRAENENELWKKQKADLLKAPGLLRLRLLREKDDSLIYTEWGTEADFKRWLATSGHANETWQIYAVAADAGVGGRSDYRSPGFDLKVEELFAQESPEQKRVVARSRAAGLPPINVGRLEGRLLEILLRTAGARRGVEIGTLGGYSSTWIARALPQDGKLITLEIDPERARLAAESLKEAGLEHKVEVRTGDARKLLSDLSELRDLDFVFCDADKAAYGDYARWALPRLRVGGLFLADNAYLWEGMLHFGEAPEKLELGPQGSPYHYSRAQFAGMSECWSELRAHPEFASIILPTGEGLAVAVKCELR